MTEGFGGEPFPHSAHEGSSNRPLFVVFSLPYHSDYSNRATALGARQFDAEGLRAPSSRDLKRRIDIGTIFGTGPQEHTCMDT